jgi:CRP-like cAMP-binding protein
VSHFLHRFWETLGYMANTLIFFLVGLVIAKQVERAKLADLLLILAAYVAVMAIRFGLTYACQPLANRWSDGVSSKDAAVMSWGGLRGAVSLALGLVVAQNPEIDPDLRRQILLVTAGVVLLTILVNGATIGRLLARFGYDAPPLSEQIAQLSARAHVLDEVCEAVAGVSQSRDLRAVPWGEAQDRLGKRRRRLEQQIQRTQRALDEASESERVTGHWRRVLGLERQAYWQAFAHGTLGASATQLLSRELDRQLDRLNRGQLAPPATRTPPDAGLGWLAFLRRRATDFDRLALIYDLSRAESHAAGKVLDALPTLSGIDSRTAEQIRATYRDYLRRGKERIEDMRTNLPELATAIETRLARRIELNFEREGYEQLAEAGVLDETTAHAELRAVEDRMQAQRRAPTRVPIPETAELVASTPLFASLDARALEMLAEITEEKVVPAGEYLFHENDKGASLFVIARGAVHVIIREAGAELVVNVLGGGDILGEMSLLTGAPRTASARAVTSVTLGEVSREGFSRLMAAQPELGERIWKEFGKRRFDNLCRRLAQFSYLDHEQRVAWYSSGAFLTLESGRDCEVAADYSYVFLTAGSVRLGERSYPAPSFFSVQAARRVVAVEEARLVLLADPSLVVSPRSTRAGLSVIATTVHQGD